MLTPDRIKPLLIHDDPDVRNLATKYFSDSWSDDADLLPLVLDACERHGFEEDLNNLYDAGCFNVTEVALDRLLDLLARVEDETVIGRLNGIVAEAPVEIVRDRQEVIEGHSSVLPETRLRLQRRRDFLDWSGERLWEELQGFARRSEDKHYTNEIDQDEVDDLVEALGRHDVPDAGTICRLLRELEPEEGWLEVFLVDLAGRRRLREAVPILVDKFQIDTDYLLERCSDALARIGDPEAAPLIRQPYPESPFHFRLYTATLLGKLKHPESEAAILALLESETDEDIRVWLCSALCDLFSEQSLDVVLREVRSGDVTAFRELAAPAAALAAVLEAEPSGELEVLEQERRRQRDLMKKIRDDPAGMLQPFWSEDDDFDELEEWDVPEPPVPQPIRNTGARAGRNDPCPCGSGKKYKKCCGRSG